MRLIIGKKVICNKGRLRKILKQAHSEKRHKTQPNLYHYILGVYNSSWLGICIYNNVNIQDEDYFKLPDRFK